MDNLTLPQQVEKMDLDRLRTYAQHLDFYNGLQWSGWARRGERRLTFNYAKAFIDKLTSYLMAGLSFSIEPSDASPEATDKARQAEDALREVNEANNLLQKAESSSTPISSTWSTRQSTIYQSRRAPASGTTAKVYLEWL